MNPRPSHKELTARIHSAKALVSEEKVVLVEPDVIIDDAQTLGYSIAEICTVLIELLEATSPECYSGSHPPQRSYERKINEEELFAFSTIVERFHPPIYYKFALKNMFFYLVSLHEDRPRVRK